MTESELKIGEIVRPPEEVVAAFREISASTLGNVCDELGFPGVIAGIKPVAAGFRFAGTAFTVKETTGTQGTYTSADLRLGAIFDAAAPGDAIVVDNDGHGVSTWGEIASLTALQRGFAGLVMDGGVRDADEIAESRFPVFSRHVTPLSGRTRVKILSINSIVKIDGVRVRPGDIIVADGTGVVCIPRELAAEALERAQAFQRDDREAIAKIRGGGTFGEAYKARFVNAKQRS